MWGEAVRRNPWERGLTVPLGRIAQPGLEQHHDTVKAVGSNPTATTMEQYAYNEQEGVTAATTSGEIPQTIDRIYKALAVLAETAGNFIERVNPVLRFENTIQKESSDVPPNDSASPFHSGLIDIEQTILTQTKKLSSAAQRITL